MKKTTKTVLLGGPLVLSAFLFGAATYFYAKAIKRGTQVDLHSEPPGLSVPITQEEDASKRLGSFLISYLIRD